MNSKGKFPEEVLIEVYKLLPLQGVLTDYNGVIYNIGDTVMIKRKVKMHNYKIGKVVRGLSHVGIGAGEKPDIYLTIDKKFPVIIMPSADITAFGIVNRILYTTPRPWKAFVVTVMTDEDTGAMYCLYGVKYKKKRDDKELKEKLARAERALTRAGFTDNGGEE